MNTEFGKISRVSFGIGGYQDVMIGLNLQFEGKGWGCGDFIGAWDWVFSKDKDDTYKASLNEQYAKTTHRISELLSQAKCKDVESLLGKPVEVTFDSMKMVSWRILEEVI